MSAVGALRARSARPPRFAGIWVATFLLFAISPLLASGSLSGTAILSMLPFAAILAIAANGQTLVVQQRGLDLSVPGMITLTTIIVTKYPNGDPGKLPVAIGLVALACVVAGLVSGLAIAFLDITPLVATLGVNALLTGVVLDITSGSATASAPSNLARFAVGRSAWFPHVFWVAAGVVLAMSILLRNSIAGRRFVAAGASPAAARAAGIRIRGYEASTYVVASLYYGAAGILVAGYLQTPGIGAGNDYLLPTIAAVVLGGTSLAGGTGSLVATAGGALFLQQLQQVVLGMGAPQAVQYVIQGSIIALGMAVRTIPLRRLLARLPARGAGGVGSQGFDTPVAGPEGQA